jgi:chromosome segregation ATPase
MNTFWRVFGGTILSIIVLILITICNQFSTSLSDLRRDLNQQSEARSEFVKKADLDRSLTSVWTGMKEGRVAAGVLDSMNDKAKCLEQQFDRQVKNASDDHKELKAQIDEQRKSLQEDSKDTVKKVEELRKTLDEERKEFQRKLDEQRKAADEEHKALTSKLQSLAERLAAVESVQNAGKSIATPAITPAKKTTIIESDLP